MLYYRADLIHVQCRFIECTLSDFKITGFPTRNGTAALTNYHPESVTDSRSRSSSAFQKFSISVPSFKMVKLFEIFFLFVAQFFINAGIYILETLLEYC